MTKNDAVVLIAAHIRGRATPDPKRGITIEDCESMTKDAIRMANALEAAGAFEEEPIDSADPFGHVPAAPPRRLNANKPADRGKAPPPARVLPGGRPKSMLQLATCGTCGEPMGDNPATHVCKTG